jgi:undecaprenyl-diphosphatase
MILQDENHIHLFIIGNIVAFVVALLAVKLYQCPYKIRFQIWGWKIALLDRTINLFLYQIMERLTAENYLEGSDY